jgi:hypothetical protein
MAKNRVAFNQEFVPVQRTISSVALALILSSQNQKKQQITLILG